MLDKITPYEEERPWGGFRQFIHNTPATVKILRVKAGEAFSLQYHNKRAEFWKIIRGTAEVTVGDTIHQTEEGEEIFVPQKATHRIRGVTDVEVLEIGFGDFDENDIVRIEDKYGRN